MYKHSPLANAAPPSFQRSGLPALHRLPAVRRRHGKILLVVLGEHGLNWVLDCAPVYVGVLHGIETELAERGSQMMLRHAATEEELEGLCRSQAADGFIVLGFEDVRDKSLSKTLEDLPTVWTMGSPLKFRGDHILPDHLGIGALGAEFLLERGHRHCALRGSSLGSPANQMQLRNNGFRWTIENAGGTVDMLLDRCLIQRTSRQNTVSGEILDLAVARLAASDPRPTALFLESDMLAPGIYQRLLKVGLSPREDLEIVSCNNEAAYLTALHPKPAIVDIQPQMIGRRTVEQLFWRIENPLAPRVRIMIEPCLL